MDPLILLVQIRRYLGSTLTQNLEIVFDILDPLITPSNLLKTNTNFPFARYQLSCSRWGCGVQFVAGLFLPVHPAMGPHLSSPHSHMPSHLCLSALSPPPLLPSSTPFLPSHQTPPTQFPSLPPDSPSSLTLELDSTPKLRPGPPIFSVWCLADSRQYFFTGIFR